MVIFHGYAKVRGLLLVAAERELLVKALLKSLEYM